MILDCDRLWTRLVSAVYRLRRLPRVTNDPPAVERPAVDHGAGNRRIEGGAA